jgi:hypothetical protein
LEGFLQAIAVLVGGGGFEGKEQRAQTLGKEGRRGKDGGD